jgi:predicted nucleic acid-binding protein
VLLNTLDRGEAAVIQLALDEGVHTVCIDEAAGRRIARLNGLSVRGAISIARKSSEKNDENNRPGTPPSLFWIKAVFV